MAKAYYNIDSFLQHGNVRGDIRLMHKTSGQSSGSVKKFMGNAVPTPAWEYGDIHYSDGIYLSGILDLEYGDTVIFVVFP